MKFILNRFALNAADVVRAGSVQMNQSLLTAEFFHDHRLQPREALAKLLPKDGIGAELGVFTGLFSTILLKETRPRKMYFVDPWWEEFGNCYPDWGNYTDHGKLATSLAHSVAKQRIGRWSGRAEVELVVDYSTRFLAGVPDRALDWVYLDSTHSYHGTCNELAMLRTKVKSGGMIAGDDWVDDPSHQHAGVAQAVREAVTRNEFDTIVRPPAFQWAIRVP